MRRRVTAAAGSLCALILAADLAADTPSPGNDTSRRAEPGVFATLERKEAVFFLDVATPSPDFTTWIEGELIRVDIPSNWRELPASNAAMFAPDGAYGNVGVSSVFTHGVGIGLMRNDRHDLASTTDAFIDARVFAGARGGRTVTYGHVAFAARPGLHTVLTTLSVVTGQPQRVEVFTTLLRDETLFYVMAISPSTCEAAYAASFRRVVESIAIMDCDGCTPS